MVTHDVTSDRIRVALRTDRVIDITTIGRNSGKPSRIETWFYREDGKLYLTGSPGKRDWYANLVANPRFTFHLKRGAQADLDATATPITDPEVRRSIFSAIFGDIGHPASDLDSWLKGSPLVHVAIEGYEEPI